MRPSLVKEFSRVAAVPREVVKIELLSISQASVTPQTLEIFMFERDQDKYDAIAATMYALLSSQGYRGVHIFFVRLTPALYYKNGEPLGSVPWLP